MLWTESVRIHTMIMTQWNQHDCMRQFVMIAIHSRNWNIQLWRKFILVQVVVHWHWMRRQQILLKLTYFSYTNSFSIFQRIISYSTTIMWCFAKLSKKSLQNSTYKQNNIMAKNVQSTWPFVVNAASINAYIPEHSCFWIIAIACRYCLDYIVQFPFCHYKS